MRECVSESVSESARMPERASECVCARESQGPEEGPLVRPCMLPARGERERGRART